MSDNAINKYFNKKHIGWCITGFLKECNEEPYQASIDDYLKSLQNIVNTDQGKRREKAQYLLDRYKKASIFFCWKCQEKKWRGENLLVSSPFKSLSRATKPALGHRQSLSLSVVQVS